MAPRIGERELRLFAADCAEHVRERPYAEAAIIIAWAIANAAAQDAARTAARTTAWTTAWAAEVQWQRQHFDEMFGNIFD